MTQEFKKKSLIQKIPWWLHLLFAILSYCFLSYLLPSIGTAESATGKLLQMAPQAAPIVAAAFLLLAANALYKDDPQKDTNTDINTEEAGPDKDETLPQ